MFSKLSYPYAGITRIRFMGMISAFFVEVAFGNLFRHPLIEIWCEGNGFLVTGKILLKKHFSLFLVVSFFTIFAQLILKQ